MMIVEAVPVPSLVSRHVAALVAAVLQPRTVSCSWLPPPPRSDIGKSAQNAAGRPTMIKRAVRRYGLRIAGHVAGERARDRTYVGGVVALRTTCSATLSRRDPNPIVEIATD